MFSIRPSSGVPIYRQIVDQTRLLIGSGVLAEGSQMPSVRALAQELGINPMTVSKAYSLLEGEQLLLRKRGVGMVVGANTDVASITLESPARDLVDLARRMGLSEQALIKLIRTLWRES